MRYETAKAEFVSFKAAVQAATDACYSLWHYLPPGTEEMTFGEARAALPALEDWSNMSTCAPVQGGFRISLNCGMNFVFKKIHRRVVVEVDLPANFHSVRLPLWKAGFRGFALRQAATQKREARRSLRARDDEKPPSLVAAYNSLMPGLIRDAADRQTNHRIREILLRRADRVEAGKIVRRSRGERGERGERRPRRSATFQFDIGSIKAG